MKEFSSNEIAFGIHFFCLESNSMSSDAIDSVLAASSLYEVLGVSQSDLTEDPDLIRRKYKQIALRVHPDKSSDDRSEQAFKKVHRAYTVLSDPVLRDVYDKYGDSMDGEGSMVEQAKAMFPGMKLDVAIEILGLVLGHPGGVARHSPISMEEIKEVQKSLEKNSRKKNPIFVLVFLAIFYASFIF